MGKVGTTVESAKKAVARGKKAPMYTGVPRIGMYSEKGGAPSKMSPELLKAAYTYFLKHSTGKGKKDLPTLAGLQIYLGISSFAIHDWDNNAKGKTIEEGGEFTPHELSMFKEFANITTHIRKLQETTLINRALRNEYNSKIAALLLSSKHGYIEKKEIDARHTHTVNLTDLYEQAKKLRAQDVQVEQLPEPTEK